MYHLSSHGLLIRCDDCGERLTRPVRDRWRNLAHPPGWMTTTDNGVSMDFCPTCVAAALVMIEAEGER